MYVAFSSVLTQILCHWKLDGTMKCSHFLTNSDLTDN